MEVDHVEGEDVDMQLSAAATTIDSTVASSRILQSQSLQKEQQQQQQQQVEEEESMQSDQPHFPKLSAHQARGSGKQVEYRRVRCPPHRYTPLREHWEQILTPLVEYLKLQVCMNE